VNIKNLLGLNSIPKTERIATSGLTQVDRSIKSENTQDRDANGQQFYDKQKKRRQRMTPEQFHRAIAILNEKPWLQEMSWKAFETKEDDLLYAEVRDLNNAVIRRISEYDMWELFEEVRPGEEKKGQLLKKTA
jgi:hypothetical protein